MSEAHKSKYGSLRYNSGKPEFSQLDPQFILDLAALMTKCAEKYEKWNWAKGQEYLTPLDSMFRHLAAFTAGEDIDPESGHPHMQHIAANCMIIERSRKIGDPELDNRFNGFKKEQK